QHCSTRIRTVVILWSGQLCHLAALNKLLEGAGGFSEQDGASHGFVGQFRQLNLLDTGNLGKYLEGVRKIAAHCLVNVYRDVFEHTEAPTFLRGIGSIGIRSVNTCWVERIRAGDGLQY